MSGTGVRWCRLSWAREARLPIGKATLCDRTEMAASSRWAIRLCCPPFCGSLIILRLPESKLAATFRLREASWNGAVRLFTLLISLLIFTEVAWAQDGTEAPRAHGFTVLGKPKLPADFQAFPYVNVNAPKGGTVNLAAVGTFDSFNPFILRGTAEAHTVSPWITLPGGAGSGSTVGHLWETLLTSSADEIATGYCHICETIEVPADKTWVAFNLRPGAKFSDGTPITADDVAWTFNTLLAQGRPSMRVQFVDVKDVEVEGPRRVRFNFKSTQNRELPLMVGGLPVLPKHFFDGRDFTAPLTATPIGSGPYRISGFELGRSVTYTRDPNWWGAALPPGRGPNNF